MSVYDLREGDLVEVSIKDNKPNKDSPLILIPIIGVEGHIRGWAFISK